MSRDSSQHPQTNNLPYYDSAKKWLWGCFSSLYNAPSVLIQYANTHFVTKGAKFLRDQFTWLSTKTVNVISDGANYIAETATWSGKKIQGGVDYTAESIRQQQKFAVKSTDYDALSYLISAVALGATSTFLAINDKAARNVLIGSLGFIAAVGSVVSLDSFFDLAVERKTLEAAYGFAHDAAIAIMKLVIASELSAMFASSMKATATGIAIYNPITAAIISSILAAAVTTAIVGSITHYEKLYLPRDARNLFFDSPLKALEKLCEKKIKYQKAVKEIDGLTKKQLSDIEYEIKALTQDIAKFKTLEDQLQLSKTALENNNSEENRASYKAAKDALLKEENKYFAQKERESYVKDCLSSTAATLFKHLLPGAYAGFILSNSVKHILDETLHISPQNIYGIVKKKVIETVLPSVNYMIDKITPVIGPIASTTATFLGSVQLMSFAKSGIVKEADKKIREYSEQHVDTALSTAYSLSVDITDTAIGIINKIYQALGGAAPTL